VAVSDPQSEDARFEFRSGTEYPDKRFFVLYFSSCRKILGLYSETRTTAVHLCNCKWQNYSSSFARHI